MLALALAATAAFAFNMPREMVGEYAQDPNNPGTWFDLTNEVPGEDTYQCDGEMETCTRDQPNPSGTEIKTGEFIQNGELPVHED